MIDKQVTGLSVCWNTKELIQRAYESVRKFHPKMDVIILDGSDANNECAKYLNNLEDNHLFIVHTGYNIGHGRGANLLIDLVETDFFMLFDSDIEMIKSPIEEMLSIGQPDTYGIGHCVTVGRDGFPYEKQRHGETRIKYLHAYFQLVRKREYFSFERYIHHGAPCINAMNNLHDRGLAHRLIHFPNLSSYIYHDAEHHGGTGRMRIAQGLPHIEGAWEKVK
jgi:hypothetical protein